MRFSWKVFLCCILITASALSFGGYYLVNEMFAKSIEREVTQALDEISLLAFAFETAAHSIPEKYGQLQDKSIREIAGTLGRNMRIRAEDFSILYESGEFTADDDIFQIYANQPENGASLLETDNIRVYRVVKLESTKTYGIQAATALQLNGRWIYMETLRDITGAFTQRDDNFKLYRQVSAVILIFEAAVIYMVSIFLTRPIKHLSRAANSMASGNYSMRAKVRSNDELGALTNDFNKMAEALEEKILKLEDEARKREDFVAAFAHEMKTPLTAIIGYSDLLRLKKLDEERHFLSADYIYREGRRLEALSLRLLDLIVLKRTDLLSAPVDASEIFSRLKYTFSSKGDLIHIDYDDVKIEAESALIVTVLQNLVDNALKASDDASPVYIKAKRIGTWRQNPAGFEQDFRANSLTDSSNLIGVKERGVYMISVEDSGNGISKDELGKITEAFYMVDKSRSRNRNGAGLGLSLCVEILSLHGSELKIESEETVGTRASFCLLCADEAHLKESKTL